MAVQIYVNVNESGDISESLVGERVIPEKQYDYFFYRKNLTVEEVLQNIPNYRVINGELTL